MLIRTSIFKPYFESVTLIYSYMLQVNPRGRNPQVIQLRNGRSSLKHFNQNEFVNCTRSNKLTKHATITAFVYRWVLTCSSFYSLDVRCFVYVFIFFALPTTPEVSSCEQVSPIFTPTPKPGINNC